VKLATDNIASQLCSNMTIKKLEDVLKLNRTVPAVNQVRLAFSLDYPCICEVRRDASSNLSWLFSHAIVTLESEFSPDLVWIVVLNKDLCRILNHKNDSFQGLSNPYLERICVGALSLLSNFKSEPRNRSQFRQM
jgi:hypothetical protein